MIQPEYGERAGRRGTGLPNPSRETKYSGANGGMEIFVFPVQLTTSRIGNHTRLIHTLLNAMTIPVSETGSVGGEQPDFLFSLFSRPQAGLATV